MHENILIFAGNMAQYQALKDLNPEFSAAIYISGLRDLLAHKGGFYVCGPGWIDRYWDSKEEIARYLQKNNIKKYDKPYKNNDLSIQP